MNRFLRIIPALILSVLLSSCGVLKLRNAAVYYAGEPVVAGYTPEGTVEQREYVCSVKGPSHRRMIVYLPAGYADSGQSYPVLYLIHGARGYETSWIRKGNMLQITDSLFRHSLARPCIVVMPNMNQYNDDKDFENSRYKDSFESIFEIDGTVESAFLNDVVKFVDANYRTLATKEGRAVAGLSVGGLQSMYLSANFPDTFGYVGMFSPMCSIVQKPGPDNDFFHHKKRKLKEQFAEGNEPLGYYLYIGKSDFFRPQVRMYRKYLDRMGYRYTFTLSEGGHQWFNWRQYYTSMLENIFRD